MRALLILSLLPLSLAACQRAETPTPAELPDPVEAPAPADGLAGRAWAAEDSAAAPGSLVVFLDGAVLQTSCGETYRLSTWRATGDGQAVMEEDGTEIPVAYALDGDALTLRRTLVGGEVREERYRPAAVPLVCPDLR